MQTPQSQTPQPAYKKITFEEARAVMQSGQPYILLDVRTEAEYRQRRIEGAILVPYEELEERIEAALPDKNALILMYCRTGRKTGLAGREMARMGYTRMLDFGGIVIWPYGTVGG